MIKSRIIPLTVLLLCVIHFAQTQSRDRDGTILAGRQLFSVDVLGYPSDSAGVSRVDLYLEIPYESLQFVKTGDFFRANFEISLGIYDFQNTLITDKLWREELDMVSVEEIATLKPGEIIMKSVTLAPGRYYFSVQVRDMETGRSSTSRLEIAVADYPPASWTLSDAMLVKALEIVEGKKVITPNIQGTIPDASDSFFVYVKLLNGPGADSTRLVLDVVGGSDTAVISDTFLLALAQGENTLIPAVASGSLPVGDYKLRILAQPVGQTGSIPAGGTMTARAEKGFRIRWVASPIAVEDIDRAIDQMQYLVEKEELEKMKELSGPEKRSNWLRFWKRKDPTPGTDRNELMLEYYARVDYANKHFGHYAEGWKTDMGMVYIIFGMPSSIERHPFEIDSKPYEVWTYYEQNRQFVFVDATGFGDYRLQNPIWDVYQTRPR